MYVTEQDTDSGSSAEMSLSVNEKCQNAHDLDIFFQKSKSKHSTYSNLHFKLKICVQITTVYIVKLFLVGVRVHHFVFFPPLAPACQFISGVCMTNMRRG